MFTVAIPTRHRLNRVQSFVETFTKTTPDDDRPELLFIHDAPEEFDSVIYTSQLPNAKTLVFSEKSSLTRLWNKCQIYSETEWVLVCNDDAIFKDGWYEYLTETIKSNKYLQINLLHYGGFCLNRRMILKNGWHDERFKGGGYEDIDWQVRLKESNLRDLLDYSQDFKFIDHGKFDDGTNWDGKNNHFHMQEKWRKNYKHWDSPVTTARRGKKFVFHTPCFRQMPELDWYPEITKMWSKHYGVESRLQEINSYVNNEKEINI